MAGYLDGAPAGTRDPNAPVNAAVARIAQVPDNKCAGDLESAQHEFFEYQWINVATI